MQVGIMITNGGTHPPEKWAAMTASQIIKIGEAAVGPAAVFGRRMELKILDILEVAHTGLQADEKSAIATLGPDHLVKSIDPTPYVAKPVAEITFAAIGTPYEAHFASEQVQTYLQRLLGQHFGSAMHIERKTFADTIPDHPAAKAYVAKYDQGVTVQTPAQL